MDDWVTLLAWAVAISSRWIWSKACGRSGRTLFSSISWRWFSLACSSPDWVKEVMKEVMEGGDEGVLKEVGESSPIYTEPFIRSFY